jgi:hypothetical protein
MAQITIDDVVTHTTPQAMMQAIDTNFTEVYGDIADLVANSGEPNNISDINATDLTDGGESTLHYHASDRNRSNHTGTQTASTISDFDEAVSSNADVITALGYEPNLAEGFSENTVTVISTNGTNATLEACSTLRAGIVTKAQFDQFNAGAASYTEPWK